MITQKTLEEYRLRFDSSEVLRKIVNFLQQSTTRGEGGIKVARVTVKLLMETIATAPKREEIQNLLDDFDTMKMVLQIFAEANLEDELLLEFLTLGYMLMEGGNRRIQKTVYNFFVTTQYTEKFFEKLRNIITTETDKLNKLDPSSIGPETFEEGSLQMGLLEKALKLLQCFAENHYVELQNYLREQHNCRNSINMVYYVLELLRAYLSKERQGYYENILQCFDTLNEFVQGPCKENQMAVLDGKFLELARMLFERKKKKTSSMKKGERRSESKMKGNLRSIAHQMKKTKHREFPKWMTERMRHRCLMLLMSLLEGQDDYQVLKRITQAISLDDLKYNMAKIYGRFLKKSDHTFGRKALGMVHPHALTITSPTLVQPRPTRHREGGEDDTRRP
jgi:hypothetical protein